LIVFQSLLKALAFISVPLPLLLHFTHHKLTRTHAQAYKTFFHTRTLTLAHTHVYRSLYS